VLQRHNHNNGFKTVMLFGAIWGLLLLVGAAMAAYLGNAGIIWVFALIGVATTAYGYWNSDKLAIKAMRAVPVTEAEQPAMYRIVRELSAVAQQPMPRLYVSPTMAPNAFATGRNPKNSAVCCTVGILELLDERELRGVLGHELMHVYNRDILTSSVAAAVAGIITSFAQFAQLSFLFGRGNNNNPLAMIGVLASAILAPIAATLIQLAISRTREYDADEDGSALTGDPLALASALRKLEQGTQRAPLPPERQLVNASHLFIANPFKKGGGMQSMFATHPPMDQRIARLEQLAYGSPR
jgi:heat shock protein HtpX